MYEINVKRLVQRVDLLNPKEASALDQSVKELLDLCNRDLHSPEGKCDRVWPALKGSPLHVHVLPQLTLVPLDRVGAQQGQSGSRVMIAYFSDLSKQVPRSNPLVVKIKKRDRKKIDGTKGRDVLEDEWTNADSIKNYIQYKTSRFATPVHHTPPTGGSHSVLWSPFKSHKFTHSGNGLGLGENNLLKVLQSGSEERCQTLIRGAFKLLWQVHACRREGCNEAGVSQRDILGHYADYLRGITWKPWGRLWTLAWGGKTRVRVNEVGRDWLNPLWVLSKLRGVRRSIYRGGVHGDLHPRNVILDEHGSPCIIDFGWSGVKRHVAQDFVLLESNLRFVALQAAAPVESLLDMCTWVGFDEDPPTSLRDEHCRRMVNLIKMVRRIARRHIRGKQDWDCEYVVPLFLVSLGLLRHLETFDNQLAARLTVLGLASYLGEEDRLQRMLSAEV
jgi:hypothetical protein